MTTDAARQLLDQAIELEESGDTEQAVIVYCNVITEAPDWPVPYYNLGLLYKYQNNWPLSYSHNQKALALDPGNEAARWNLGIAATALNDWKTARESWNYFGLNLEITNEEPQLYLSRAPVRLNPDEEGEVVWCTRIDPARAIIDNIPLASCGHRYGDIVLNDGAPVGYRISDGQEYPVFNELQLIAKSKCSTYSIRAYTNEQQHIDKLIALCEIVNVEIEDWSTIKILCKQCSEGVAHDHHDEELRDEINTDRYIGFASLCKDAVEKVLNNWRAISLCDHSELILEQE